MDKLELRSKAKTDLSNCLGGRRGVCELCSLWRDFCQGTPSDFEGNCYLLS